MSKGLILYLRVKFLKEIDSKTDLIIEKSFEIEQIVFKVYERHLAIFWENV